MSRTVEITPAPNGMAYVEVWTNGRMTHKTGCMPVPAARLHAEVLGCNVVDHTLVEFGTVRSNRDAVEVLRGFRPSR